MFLRHLCVPRRIGAGLLLAAAASCGSDTPTQADPVYIASATFGGPSADPAAEDGASPVAGGAPGTIRVTGTIRLPGPCYDLDAGVDAPAGQVILHVTATQRAAGCAAQVTQVAYDVLIGGSSPGPHVVGVDHTVEVGKIANVYHVTAGTVVVP